MYAELLKRVIVVKIICKFIQTCNFYMKRVNMRLEVEIHCVIFIVQHISIFNDVTG